MINEIKLKQDPKVDPYHFARHTLVASQSISFSSHPEVKKFLDKFLFLLARGTFLSATVFLCNKTVHILLVP